MAPAQPAPPGGVHAAAPAAPRACSGAPPRRARQALGRRREPGRRGSPAPGHRILAQDVRSVRLRGAGGSCASPRSSTWRSASCAPRCTAIRLSARPPSGSRSARCRTRTGAPFRRTDRCGATISSTSAPARRSPGARCASRSVCSIMSSGSRPASRAWRAWRRRSRTRASYPPLTPSSRVGSPTPGASRVAPCSCSCAGPRPTTSARSSCTRAMPWACRR